MSAYRSPEERPPFVMRVGLPGWFVLVAACLLLMLVAFRSGQLFASLLLFSGAFLFVWLRRKSIVIDPNERVIEIDGRTLRVEQIVGVSARSQLELVISVDDGEDVVLVPAGLTDAAVLRRANLLRDALDELR